MADKLSVNDPRVTRHKATVNGRSYHYIVATPAAEPVDTILLAHGWPDVGHGWRFQVPALLALNYRVIVHDQLGFGESDAPQELAEYTLKSISGDLFALVEQIVGNNQPIVLGGHDWGGALVWRMVLWHPDRVKAVFSICTPYAPPLPVWLDDKRYVERLPNFAYQLQLAGPDVEANIVGKDKLRGFLNGMYYGRGPNGETAFSTERGVHFENIDKIGPSPLLSKEEVDFYVDKYAHNGMRGPLNWYRTRRLNWEQEQELLQSEERVQIAVPALMVTASKDVALPPTMAAGMPQYIKQLTIREVNASHWALWEKPEEVNGHIKEFLAAVQDKTPKASI